MHFLGEAVEAPLELPQDNGLLPKDLFERAGQVGILGSDRSHGLVPQFAVCHAHSKK
jgi:hypothetical protein